ncbi:MAG: ATP-binding cassette domain-containing protein, partial [Bacilli bacterium]|nr:ATP-binding cassette domain-containing protein [Bacilli bacterium]
LKLENIMNQKAKSLSGGERQRVAIARAITKDSSIILADEPTASIDAESKNIILKLLKELSKSRLVILISHDKIEISDFEDEIIYLDQGKVKIVKKNKDRKGKVKNFSKYCNHFNCYHFTFRNHFVNIKMLIRNSILLIFLILILLVSLLVSLENIEDVHINTLLTENDTMLTVSKQRQLEDLSWINDCSGFLEEDLKVFNDLNLQNSFIDIKTIHDNYEPIMFEIPFSQENSYLISLNQLYFTSNKYIDPKYGTNPINKNEIVISTYLADSIIEFGIIDSQEELFNPKNYEDLLKTDRFLKLGLADVKVVGIYELDLNKFYNIWIGDFNSEQYEVFKKYVNKYASIVYVNDSFYDLYQNLEPLLYRDTRFYISEEEFTYNINIFQNPILSRGGDEINELADDEIIVSEDIMKLLNLTDNNMNENITLTIKANSAGLKEVLSFKIVGVSQGNGIYINESSISDFYSKNIIVNNILVRGDNKDDLKKIFNIFPNFNSKYIMSTSFSEKYNIIKKDMQIIKTVLIILTIVLTIIIIICIVNYLFDSIGLHKSDIAILKSLGLNDFKIILSFFIESFIVLFISYIIAVGIFLPFTQIFNAYFSAKMAFKCDIIYNNFFIIILLGIMLLIADALILFWILSKIKNIIPKVINEKNEL